MTTNTPRHVIEAPGAVGEGSVAVGFVHRYLAGPADVPQQPTDRSATSTTAG